MYIFSNLKVMLDEWVSDPYSLIDTPWAVNLVMKLSFYMRGWSINNEFLGKCYNYLWFPWSRPGNSQLITIFVLSRVDIFPFVGD